jgi:hypothetical protein
VSVENHIRQPGTYEDLRGFLLDHTGHRVTVAVDAPQSMDGVSVAFRAEGILRPVTLTDHERMYARLAERMYERFGNCPFDDRELAEHLAYLVEHQADFKLVDSRGNETASMQLCEWFVRNVEIGRIGSVNGDNGEEIVVTTDYADFCVEVLRWDYDHLDEDDCPGELPSQLLRFRVERWVERSLEQTLREAPRERA